MNRRDWNKIGEPVKPARPYDGRRRREQAQQTRLAVLASARRLFLERGIAATTIPLVAADSGVSAPTVYKAFRNKATLLKAVFDHAVAGDDEPVPLLQRERAARLRAEPDPRQKLHIYTDGFIGTLTRAAPLHLLARAAADGDSEMASVWSQIQAERLTGMTYLADHLAEGGHLAPTISAADARDILWAYTSPELYQLLVLQRAWPPERYRDWIRDTLVDALLRS